MGEGGCVSKLGAFDASNGLAFIESGLHARGEANRYLEIIRSRFGGGYPSCVSPTTPFGFFQIWLSGNRTLTEFKIGYKVKIFPLEIIFTIQASDYLYSYPDTLLTAVGGCSQIIENMTRVQGLFLGVIGNPPLYDVAETTHFEVIDTGIVYAVPSNLCLLEQTFCPGISTIRARTHQNSDY